MNYTHALSHYELSWVTNKDSGVLFPLHTDEFVRREPAQVIEVFSMTAGQQKCLQVLVELGRSFVMVALQGGLLNRAVQVLGAFVGSRQGRLGYVVFRAVLAAAEVETWPIG